MTLNTVIKNYHKLQDIDDTRKTLLILVKDGLNYKLSPPTHSKHQE